MKKILFALCIFCTILAHGQYIRPTGTNIKTIQTYSFYYNTVDSTVGMWKGPDYLCNYFWSRQDTSKLKSIVTKWYVRKNLFLRTDTTLNAGPATNYKLNQKIGGSGVNGFIPHFTAAGTIDSSGIYWNPNTKRAGWNTTSPTADIHVDVATGKQAAAITMGNTGTAQNNNSLITLSNIAYISASYANASSYYPTFGLNLAYEGVVGGSGRYFTPRTFVSGIGYRGISFKYDDGIEFLAGTGATTANSSVTPTKILVLKNSGATGFSVTSPTAYAHLHAGSATAATAPLKFNSGTLLSVPEAGAVEFLTDKWYGTITTGTARKEFAFVNDSSKFYKFKSDTAGNKGWASRYYVDTHSTSYPGAGIPVSTGSAWGTSISLSTLDWRVLQHDGTWNYLPLGALDGVYLGTPSDKDALAYNSSTSHWENRGGIFEPALGNPASNGYVLSSTTAGVRSWVANGSGGGSMTYPGAGIAVSTGSAWSTSITNNSANWNTAYGWGNWASNFGTTSGTIAQGNHTHSIYLAKNADDTSTGNITAVNFILSSDSTLKSKIRPISFTGIEKIQWVNFELKKKPGINRAGVVAQDVKKIFPDFVYKDKNGKLSVAYVDLLITKIAELESRIKKLENEK